MPQCIYPVSWCIHITKHYTAVKTNFSVICNSVSVAFDWVLRKCQAWTECGNVVLGEMLRQKMGEKAGRAVGLTLTEGGGKEGWLEGN